VLLDFVLELLGGTVWGRVIRHRGYRACLFLVDFVFDSSTHLEDQTTAV
jgi:hypothetical protein